MPFTSNLQRRAYAEREDTLACKFPGKLIEPEAASLVSSQGQAPQGGHGNDPRGHSGFGGQPSGQSGSTWTSEESFAVAGIEFAAA